MSITKKAYVYILFNKRNGTLYTGVTSDLVKRVNQHKTKATDGFTGRYDVNKLGYYEVHSDIQAAREREYQIKAGSRNKKLELIQGMNPYWNDLYESVLRG
ncbi:MAG: GIY-YIG nuclease family protein [Firmicutes bacterium]|nr:GIY-YIG nuclease family protein [Bacillota bacterium]